MNNTNKHVTFLRCKNDDQSLMQLLEDLDCEVSYETLTKVIGA